MTLKLGYKASAEQFAPRPLLDFSVAAEQARVRFRLRQRPLPAVEAHRRACAVRVGLAGRAGRQHAADRDGHQRADADLPLSSVRGRAGVRHAGFDVPGPRDPGRRHRRGAERGALHRHEMARNEGTLRPAARGDQPDPQAVAEDHVTFEGEYYKTQSATIYDKPGASVPIYVAGAGPQVAKYAGRMADGFICTSGKKWDLYTETLLPNVAEGLALSAKPKPDYDRMIEMKVSFDTDKQRALEDTRIWAALALTPEEKVSVHDPREMERLADALPIERAASRWIVSTDPDEHIEKIKPYIDMGFRHLVFHAPGNDQARFLKLYGELVLPKLRQRFG